MAAYQNWGATLANLRQFPDAAEKFAEARRIGPESYRLLGNTARALYWSGRRPEAAALYPRAIEMVSQALRVNPSDIDARVSLAAYYAKSGDRAGALTQLNALPSTLDDPHVLVFGAVVYVDLADHTKALDWLEQAATRGLAASELQDWIELDALKTNPRFAALRTR